MSSCPRGFLMSLGKLEVLERPKSKWPYWLLYRYENTYWPYNHTEDLKHIYLKIDLLQNKIPHCVERQWAQNTGANGRKYKTQYGILYKFLKEEDRLIFLMSQETDNELS